MEASSEGIPAAGRGATSGMSAYSCHLGQVSTRLDASLITTRSGLSSFVVSLLRATHPSLVISPVPAADIAYL